MATVNKRLKLPQAITINGVAAGGAMTVNIMAGYENVMRSSPDGLQVPIKDKEIQFVRGTVVTQDWVEALNLLTGAAGTLVFYERKSGVAETTGFVKHTITNPVIHNFNLAFTKGGYAICTFAFECMAADPTKGIADMWAMTDTQAAPTYVTAARGGWRIKTAVLGALSIYHVTGFSFAINTRLDKACNDSDVGYTCVDAELSGMSCGGSLSFQDGEITTGALKCQQLLAAAAASLVITVYQSQGAANKIITIAKADFDNVGDNSDVNSPFTGYTANFDVANNTTTPLTIAGANKIITIADAA